MKRKIWYVLISIFVLLAIIASTAICKNEIKIALEEQKQNIKQFVGKTANFLSTLSNEGEPQTWDISADDGTSHVTATLYGDGKLVLEGNGATKNYKFPEARK